MLWFRTRTADWAVALVLATVVSADSSSHGVAAEPVDSATHAPRPATCAVRPLGRVIRHTTGFPPHRVWSLPGDRSRQWGPVAMDAQHVLMLRMRTGRPSLIPTRQTVRLALATIGSRALQPVPPGAYPHVLVLPACLVRCELPARTLQMEGRWIVGLTDSMHDTWQLWAGDLATGRSWVIDHGSHGGRRGASFHEAGSFALQGGHVVWPYNSNRSRPGSGRETVQSRLALYDLARRRTTLLGLAPEHVIYTAPSLWGTRLAWEAVRYVDRSGSVVGSVDVLLQDLRSGAVTALTHNARTGSESQSPSFFGRLVLMVNKVPASGIVLMDIRTRRHWVLDSEGDSPLLGSSLAAWQKSHTPADGPTSAVFDLTRSTIWTIPDQRTERFSWIPIAVNGRTVLMIQTTGGQGEGPERRSYVVWQIPCG